MSAPYVLIGNIYYVNPAVIELVALGDALAVAVESQHEKHTMWMTTGAIAPGPKGPTYMARVPSMAECVHALCLAASAWRAARETPG